MHRLQNVGRGLRLMTSSRSTIDHRTLRSLLAAGTRVRAEASASGRAWGVVVTYGQVRQTLVAARGEPRTFRQFETLAGYLKALGIVELRVDVSAFEPGAPYGPTTDRRGASASERMKRAHEAAAHDAWFRQQVQAAIDDPRPSLDDEQVRELMAARLKTLVESSGSVPDAATALSPTDSSGA